MRLPYFRLAVRQAELIAAIHAAGKTRWRHMGVRPESAELGVQADCLTFGVDLMKKLGAIPARTKVPVYRRAEAASDGAKLFCESVEAVGGRQVVAPYIVGDIHAFDDGWARLHIGIVSCCAPHMFADLSTHGLMIQAFDASPLKAKLRFTYRIMEVV